MPKQKFVLAGLEPEIAVCPQGCLHLTIGPATINLPLQGLRDITELAQRYLRTIDAGNGASASKGLLH